MSNVVLNYLDQNQKAKLLLLSGLYMDCETPEIVRDISFPIIPLN